MIVDLFADIACPWCWIGERRLKRVLEARGVEAEVRWRPFQLQPTLPREGMPWAEFVAARFGGLERARPMFAHVAGAGAPEGLAYDFERITHAPNTRDAHRVMLLAEERGKTWEMADALFRAYFGEGRIVGDAAVLADVAAAAGVEADAVRDVLAGDRFVDAVEESQRIAQASQISGVPFAIFDERYAVSGAQPPEMFEMALDRARAETANG